VRITTIVPRLGVHASKKKDIDNGVEPVQRGGSTITVKTTFQSSLVITRGKNSP
jgi:hypothetical protein